MVGQEKHRGFGFVEFYTKSDAKVSWNELFITRYNNLSLITFFLFALVESIQCFVSEYSFVREKAGLGMGRI